MTTITYPSKTATMKFKKINYRENRWVRNNLKYGSISLVVGVLISLFIGLFRQDGILLRNVMLNIMFSFFITLSITNVVNFSRQFFVPTGSGFWKFVISYYVSNLLGLAIGIELSYLMVSVIFDTRFQLFGHASDYKFTSLITLVIGTMILLFEFQKANAESALKAKEIDLVKLKQLKTQAELQALQSKINPHFLYNALNSIVSLIHEDPDKAEDMTIKLSKLFRYSINTMQENFCTVSEEIDILNTYLAIEKVRFGNRIQFEINHLPSLANKMIPRFLLQPLVENALKHGLKDRHQGGKLEVSIKEENNYLEIKVADNGVPFPDELVAGYGMQSTFDKLQLLYKDNYDLKINNQPTKNIQISIPLA